MLLYLLLLWAVFVLKPCSIKYSSEPPSSCRKNTAAAMKYTPRKLESKLSICSSMLKFQWRLLCGQIIFINQRSNHRQVKYKWITCFCGLSTLFWPLFWVCWPKLPPRLLVSSTYNGLALMCLWLILQTTLKKTQNLFILLFNTDFSSLVC